MASSKEIANWIVALFDPTSSCKLDSAIEQVLQEHGYQRFAAYTEASAKYEKVLAELLSRPPEELPFRFSSSDESRLIGKQRTRKGDTDKVTSIRQRVPLIPEMLHAVYSCGDVFFEKICAGLMHLSGASQVFATCSIDDGGIDVYGRLPLRSNDPNVEDGLITTSILSKDYFFVGQCKCYDPSIRIGRPELEQFRGSVAHCLSKYEGNPRPPNQRVPDRLYRKNELCLPIFFSTADYTETAEGTAEALDIVLVNGKQIAGFLVRHNIGLTDDHTSAIDLDVLMSWANLFGPNG